MRSELVALLFDVYNLPFKMWLFYRPAIVEPDYIKPIDRKLFVLAKSQDMHRTRAPMNYYLARKRIDHCVREMPFWATVLLFACTLKVVHAQESFPTAEVSNSAGLTNSECRADQLPTIDSVQSLEQVFVEVAHRGTGDIIRADLTARGIGNVCIWVYEVKLLSESGEVTNVVYDATALRMIGFSSPAGVRSKGESRKNSDDNVFRSIGQRFGFFGRRDPTSEGRDDGPSDVGENGIAAGGDTTSDEGSSSDAPSDSSTADDGSGEDGKSGPGTAADGEGPGPGSNGGSSGSTGGTTQSNK